MPTPRGVLARIRTSLVPVMGHGDGTDAVYARAMLERAEITERYYVEQEISKNRSIALSGSPGTEHADEPPGRIEMSIPFDGHDYFTQQAYEDVTRRLAHLEPRRRMAKIGYLLLRDDEKTSLRTSLSLNDKYGAVPIEIPVTQADGSLAPLTADRKACWIRYDYEPEPPDIVPIQLAIMLYDPDSLDLPTVDLMDGQGKRHVDDVIKRIRQQVSFKSELLLHVVVRLLLPVKKDYPRPEPFVARVSVGWPTVTSLQTLSLHFGEGLTTVTSDGLKDAPVRYNPVKRRLEWEQVPMAWVRTNPADGDESICSYRSADMLLSIRHPGELYEQPSLEVHAEAEVPGYLLSGLEARLYDATGRPQKLQPKLITRVSSDVRVVLNDAFARRDFSPFQHLVFDEIIPDDMRIADIITALNDAGFTVSRVRPEHQGHEVDAETGTLNWFLAARRREGPDDMDLWIFVEGRRYTTMRETVMHGGGVTHRTRLDSGELKMFMRGTLAGDHKELAREMNALHQALRERYDRVRSRR
jgi:hypothetical protein